MKVLKKADFSIVTGIDVRNTLKQKLGVDFRSYRILGACNPRMAHETIEAENTIETRLPCNMIVQDAGGGNTGVAAIDRSGRWRQYPTRP